MERAYQVRVSKQIGLGWIEQSKENHRREVRFDKREVKIIYWIESDHSKQIGLEQ